MNYSFPSVTALHRGWTLCECVIEAPRLWSDTWQPHLPLVSIDMDLFDFLKLYTRSNYQRGCSTFGSDKQTFVKVAVHCIMNIFDRNIIKVIMIVMYLYNSIVLNERFVTDNSTLWLCKYNSNATGKGLCNITIHSVYSSD